MTAAMHTSDVMVTLALVAIVVFQIWVTWKLRQSSEYDASQKSAQTKLIWLLPLIGAAVVFAALEPEDERRPPTDSSQQ